MITAFIKTSRTDKGCIGFTISGVIPPIGSIVIDPQGGGVHRVTSVPTISQSGENVWVEVESERGFKLTGDSDWRFPSTENSKT